MYERKKCEREIERDREISMMHAGEKYDVGNDVDGVFSEEFKKYVHKKNLVCWMWRPFLHSRTFLRSRISVFTEKHETVAFNSDIVYYNHLAREIALYFIGNTCHPDACLVQFWRAEESEGDSFDGFVERRLLLTTRNQPFLLANELPLKNHNSVGLCSYRMKTRDVIISGDGRGGGPISRVFKNNRMEVTPDVAYYSYEEYPQRDTALACLVKSSVVVPLSDSCGRTTGVMEFVSPSYMSSSFIVYLLHNFTENNGCKDLCGQYGAEKDLLRSDVSEIKEVMEEVRESCDIVSAQTWILCKRCNSLSNSGRWGQELDEDGISFLEVEYFCIQQKGEGIVGKAAASSLNIVYCKDIAKFSVAEYPLAHFARLYYLSAWFTICLRSKHSEDRAYVLEFFLNPSCVNGRDLRAILVPMLNVMRHKFRTLKVVSGGETGDISIQVIDAGFPDKFETLEIGALDNHTTEMSLIDSGENMVNTTEERDVAIALLDKQHDSSAISGDKRGRKLRRSIGENETNETDDDSRLGLETSLHDMFIEGTTVYSASTVESGNFVTIKAKYGEKFIKFQLSAFSGIDAFHHQVWQRLQLEARNYTVNYQDEENDRIIVACDNDLRDYISSSKKLGKNTLVMLLEQI